MDHWFTQACNIHSGVLSCESYIWKPAVISFIGVVINSFLMVYHALDRGPHLQRKGKTVVAKLQLVKESVGLFSDAQLLWAHGHTQGKSSLSQKPLMAGKHLLVTVRVWDPFVALGSELNGTSLCSFCSHYTYRAAILFMTASHFLLYIPRWMARRWHGDLQAFSSQWQSS